MNTREQHSNQAIVLAVKEVKNAVKGNSIDCTLLDTDVDGATGTLGGRISKISFHVVSGTGDAATLNIGGKGNQNLLDGLTYTFGGDTNDILLNDFVYNANSARLQIMITRR